MSANINTIVEIVQDRAKYKDILHALSKKEVSFLLSYNKQYPSCIKLPETLQKEVKEFVIDKCNEMIEFFDKAIIEEANKETLIKYYADKINKLKQELKKELDKEL